MFWLSLAPALALLASAPPPDERRFMVSGFDRVRVDGPFQVEIVTGTSGAVASANPKALDHVSIRVQGSTLVISSGAMGWEVRADATPASARITVSMPELRALNINGGASVKVAEMRGSRVDLGLNGAGMITVAGMRADDLNVTLTGTGAITLAGTAARTRVRSYGAGSVLADDLTTGEAVLIAESAGDLRMRVRYTAQVNALGSGGVTVLGNPQCRVSGPGPVSCANR